MDNVDCEHCFRRICPYKHDYTLCKNNNKRIQKKYTEPPTILEKILTEYQLYICSIKKKYKIGRFRVNFSVTMGVLPWEHSQTYALPEIKKKLMVNTPIQSDVKIYELYFPDEDWMYHDIDKEYITNQTNTYILKDIANWRDLFEKIIHYYTKRIKNYPYGIEITSIEKVSQKHFKYKKDNIKEHQYAVKLISYE